MKKNKILVVDDQVEILHALERQLKDEYQVFTASKGEEGLKLLKSNTFAVILADQRMPGMTGIDFLSRSISMQSESIRILITAYADIQASDVA